MTHIKVANLKRRDFWKSWP